MIGTLWVMLGAVGTFLLAIAIGALATKFEWGCLFTAIGPAAAVVIYRVVNPEPGCRYECWGKVPWVFGLGLEAIAWVVGVGIGAYPRCRRPLSVRVLGGDRTTAPSRYRVRTDRGECCPSP
jgi:hypothetical protein